MTDVPKQVQWTKINGCAVMTEEHRYGTCRMHSSQAPFLLMQVLKLVPT